jgi:hypothetical protein
MGNKKVEKYKDFFRKSLIGIGDLPRWKNTEIFQKGSHYNGRPGKCKDFSKEVSL